MVLELWVCGFNAHQQLLDSSAEFPEDVTTPTLLATAESSLKPLHIGWSSLAYEADGTTRWRGVYSSDEQQKVPTTGLTATTSTSLTATAVGNTLHLSTGSTYTLSSAITSLTATSHSFTLLLSSGQVFTHGDARHSLLGRALSPEPGLVDALDGLRIAKIASGGFACAAIDEAGGCYVWGSEWEGVQLVEEVEGDVVDVAVGAGHLLLLTAQGEVWGWGRGECGQLPEGEGWRRWEVPWRGRAKGVWAGRDAWCSLVLVEREG